MSPGQSASVSNIGATFSALHTSQTSTTTMETIMLTKAAFAVGFLQNMPKTVGKNRLAAWNVNARSSS